MTADTASPAGLGSVDDDDEDDFKFVRGRSGRNNTVTSRGGSGSRKRRASKRVKQFTTKADPALLDLFYAVLDDEDLSTVMGFETAVKEFLAQRGHHYK
ncbi:hypothetical protein [Ruegeria atlantica]|uniref:hypothetical protein n=1 Tax=Ruegeria atlantica TaxID=81569 RepID=UPI002494771D|nr:hypothetical protein [Ruegeria atlantica]